MADIDVVPKQRSRTWLWMVLILIAVMLLVWAFTGRTRTVTQSWPASADAPQLMLAEMPEAMVSLA